MKGKREERRDKGEGSVKEEGKGKERGRDKGGE